MENVISARRLRKSMLNSIGSVDVDLESYKINKPRIYKDRTFSDSVNKNENTILMQFKTKLIIKLFFCSVILFSIIILKMFFLDNVKSNTTLMRMYNHYTMDFSKICILEKMEYRLNKLDFIIGNIFPDKIKEYTKDKYFYHIKPYIITFDLKSTFKNLISLDANKKEVIVEDKSIEAISSNSNYLNVNAKEEVLDGIGGAEPLEEKTEQVMSSISIMDIDVSKIKSKGISIVAPVSGVITSRYGVRQEVFAGVDPYHTGIDIANKKGTKILSATKGIVTKIEYNNKYYGNFVEITENDVIFKYGHMDSVNVSLGSVVNQKDIVGLMGSTGMSTGTHLHFEIRTDGRTVNPEELVKF